MLEYCKRSSEISSEQRLNKAIQYPSIDRRVVEISRIPETQQSNMGVLSDPRLQPIYRRRRLNIWGGTSD